MAKHALIFLLAVLLITLSCVSTSSVSQQGEVQTRTTAARKVSPTPTYLLSPRPSAAPTSNPTQSKALIPLTSNEESTPTVKIQPMLSPAPCIPPTSSYETGTVVHIVDGDTIDVEIGGQVFRVRYIGMDTPEDTSSVEYFGPQATEMNRELVEGKAVRLFKDVSETDRYDRLLRYVFVGHLFVNYELVRTGYAQVATYPPDVACQDYFISAEQEARNADVGLWAAIATPEPSATNTSLPAATFTPPPATQPPAIQPTQPPPPPTEKPTQSSSENCDPSYPTVCIPPPPPDLDCGDIPFRRFQVLPPDPHRFDGDHDGIGCES